MPPPRPDVTPDQMVHFLHQHALTIQIGFTVFAIAILLDKNAIFPKWLAYISIWQIVTELLAAPITIAAWWLGPAHTHGAIVASVGITIAVLLMGIIKARLIIQYFMEVRSAPRWLRLFTDIWLLTLWGTIFAIYLW